MPRRKSGAQIGFQADRLLQTTAERGWNGREVNANSLARMQRVQGIANRYWRNISRSFGNRGGWISNSQFQTPIPRRVYMGLNNG